MITLSPWTSTIMGNNPYPFYYVSYSIDAASSLGIGFIQILDWVKEIVKKMNYRITISSYEENGDTITLYFMLYNHLGEPSKVFLDNLPSLGFRKSLTFVPNQLPIIFDCDNGKTNTGYVYYMKPKVVPYNESLSDWTQLLFGLKPTIYLSVQEDEEDPFLDFENDLFIGIRDLFGRCGTKILYIVRNEKIFIQSEGAHIFSWSIVLDEIVPLPEILKNLEYSNDLYSAGGELHYCTVNELWEYDGDGTPPQRISISWNSQTKKITKSFNI